MIVLDVNVLVALFRRDHPRHDVVVDWWERNLADGTPITVPDVVLSGAVRIMTNGRIFAVPATPTEAFEFVRTVTDQPTYLAFRSPEAVIAEFERVCVQSDAGGDLVPDAYIAAVARCLGASVVTFDRDFRRFDGLSLVELS